jgi:nucleoside-diphosphate-sugar epimerase
MTLAASASKKVVLLVGASGRLGGLIARALLDKPDVTLRCLVRPGSQDKLKDMAGAEIVLGDVGPRSESGLEQACAGAYSVVSALQGGPEVIIEGQGRLLGAAVAMGVRRFIPSDFSFDYFKLGAGQNINSDVRRAFARLAQEKKGKSLEVVHVLNGCFLDKNVLFGFLGLFDLPAGVARQWGDGQAPMNFTTYEDTARFTAEAAVDAAALPTKFGVAGDTLSFAELVRLYEATTGKPLRIETAGSLSDLDAEIVRRRTAEPNNFYAFLPLMYVRGMVSGQGALDALQNARYPHIKPTTVAEFLRREGL